MAAAQICASMTAFDIDNGEDFTEYSERFEMFLLANGIAEADRKRAVFLATIGGPAYKLLRSLLGESVKTKPFADLVKAMKDHLQPEPNQIAERFHFFKRDRKQGESVGDYIAELRRLSERCGFGEALNTYLRDRFVCGLASERIQQKLLTVKDLTLEVALSTARSFETASRDAKMLHGGSVGGSPAVRQLGDAQEEECIHRLYQNQTGRQRPNTGGKDTRECYRCGAQGHLANACPFSKAKCHRCGKVGHIRNKCHQKEKPQTGAATRPRTTSTAAVRKVGCVCQEPECESEAPTLDPLSLYLLGRPAAVDPVMVEVTINGKPVQMEVDTGAAVTVMNRSSYARVEGDGPLEESNLRLKTYTGEIVRPSGVGRVDVVYQDQKRSLMPITVVDGNVPNLMGRDWLGQLKLQWCELFPLQQRVHKLDGASGPVNELVEQFPEVFTEKLGCLKDFKVKIPVPEGVEPKFCRARRLPYAMTSRVDDDLDRIEKQGVWKRVEYSQWAAPIVVVLKDPRDPTGPIRICGDYKQTVNKVAPLDSYPIPSTVDQLATLSGGEKFTKLDLSQAYQQLELDDSSKELLTINTHQGLFQPSRLQFGVHSATGIFQREMDRRLRRVPMTKVRVDDILVSGRNDAEHLQNVRMVLEILKKSGLTLKLAKCAFMQDEVTYCGYLINKDGVKPMPANVEAVRDAPAPTNLKELRSFLGMVNYYNNYLDGLSTITEPLHALMRKEVAWKWSAECGAAFLEVKKMLCSAPLLVHFDLRKLVVVHCDASEYGLGVVLSHIMKDGSERPVSFGSRTLSLAERNYSTIEKEGLALVFAVQKFHQYLYGNRFCMYTDHKPLLGLFAETAALPTRAASRVIRWALLLSAYNFELKYREGSKNGNADCLSRLPLSMRNGEASQRVVSVALMELVKSPVTEVDLRQKTLCDPVLEVVLRSILEGGLEKREGEEFKPFRNRVAELSTEAGVVLWGARVVIPRALQETVLTELHEVHPGMTRMKSLARSYVWWPGIDSDIETMVRQCVTCQANQSNPTSAPAHPWDYASEPWERLHIDHAGPMNGNVFLIIVDSYSKWLEVERVKSTNAKTTCAVLRKLFATHGVPRVIVSDNGPGFASEEFDQFLKMNGVRHVFSAPYHPSSNGQAERMVRVFKESLKSMGEGDIETRLCRLLFRYRITPHTLTGLSPSELLFRRRIRSVLSQLRPSVRGQIVAKQKDATEQRSVARSFEPGDVVLVSNFSRGGKWLKGVVSLAKGSVNYEVKLMDGRLVHRHLDQIVRHYSGEPVDVPQPGGLDDEMVHVPVELEPTLAASLPVTQSPAMQPVMEQSPIAMHSEPASVTAPAVVPEIVSQQSARDSEPVAERRPPSQRVRKRPAYLEEYAA